MKPFILAVVLVIVQTISVALAASTRDIDAILSADLSGVWTVEKPTDWATSYVWLYPNHQYVTRDANCSVTSQGTWDYPSMILEFTARSGKRSSLTVSQVPRTWSGGERLVFNVHKVVWQFMTRDTTLPC